MKNLEDHSAVDLLRMACFAPKHMGLVDLRNDGHEWPARKLKPLMYSTPVFDIDQEVMEAAIDLGSNYPDVMADMLPRCKPPFERAFFEYDSHAALKYVGAELDRWAPKNVGALVEQEPGSSAFYITNFAADFSNGPGQWIISLSPISYRIQTDVDQTGHHSEVFDMLKGPIWIQGAKAGESDTNLRDYFNFLIRDSVTKDEKDTFDHKVMLPMIVGSAECLGQDYDKYPELWDGFLRLSRRCSLELCHPFRDRLRKTIQDKEIVSWTVANWMGGGTRTSSIADAYKTSVLRAGIQEHYGLLRKLLGVLCLLNARDREVSWGEPFTPSGKLFSGGKTLPYFTRRRVTLLLPKQKILMREITAAREERTKRRRHAVIGHWCSSKKRGNPECSHKHIQVTPTLLECEHCHHIVWWKKGHERGDASKGFVSQEYALKRRTKIEAKRKFI